MSGFDTHGVSENQALGYLETPEGKLYRQRLMEASPKDAIDKITNRAIEQLTSGRELPRMEIINEPLVKIVPHDSTPSGHSPFWAKEAALDAALKSGKNLGQHFGLPHASSAEKYDVYRITPKAPTEVFINTVAPTSELVNGKKISTTGGATQYLTPNRKLYDEAKFVKSIDNLNIPLQKTQNPHDINTTAHAKAVHINTVVKGAGILGTAYGVYSGISDVKTAVNAAQTTEEKWRVGGQAGADVATRGVVTGVAAAVCAVPGAAAGTLVTPVAGTIAGGVVAGGACAVAAEKLYEGSTVQKGAQYVGEKAGELGHQLNNYLFGDDKAQKPEQQKTSALGDLHSQNENLLSKPLSVYATQSEMIDYAFAAMMSPDDNLMHRSLNQVTNTQAYNDIQKHSVDYMAALEKQEAPQIKSPSISFM